MNSDKKTILIVEDDKETQKFYKLFFSKYFEADICGDSKTFHSLINEKHYECIVMDIALSEKTSGLDLTREMKGIEKFSQIPIICLTAHVKEMDRKNAREAGVDFFIAKPIRPNDLLEKINSIIDSK
jgi:DNA-binding response OmpR family regulator